jgi:hypothetical protein
VLSNFPNNPIVYNDRGGAYLEIEYYDKAEIDFKKVFILIISTQSHITIWDC